MNKLFASKNLLGFKITSYAIEISTIIILVIYSIFASLKDTSIIDTINQVKVGQLPLMVFIAILLPLIILLYDGCWVGYKCYLNRQQVLKIKINSIAKIFYLDMLNYQVAKFNKFLYKNLFWLVMTMFAGISMLFYLAFGVKFYPDGTIHFNSTWTNVPLAISGSLYFVIALVLSFLYIIYFVGGFKIADYEIRKTKEYKSAQKMAHQKELTKVKVEKLKEYYFLNLISKSEYKTAIKTKKKRSRR